MPSIYDKNIDDPNIKQSIEQQDIAAASQMNQMSSVPVSELEVDTVLNARTGKNVTIRPKQVAQTVQNAIALITNDPKYSFLRPYLKKPVIWTYEANTAFTDGIRIFMDPLFTTLMIKLGAQFANEWDNTQEAKDLQKYPNTPEYTKYIETLSMKQLKYVIFVIVHECYHVLYQHIRRMILKFGNKASANVRDLANIAADMEINRDIESCFPELEGATTEFNGIWWKNYNTKEKSFQKDVFEEIFDWLLTHDPQSDTEDPFRNLKEQKDKNNDKSATGYGAGWDISVRGIQDGTLNPDEVTFI